MKRYRLFFRLRLQSFGNHNEKNYTLFADPVPAQAKKPAPCGSGPCFNRRCSDYGSGSGISIQLSTKIYAVFLSVKLRKELLNISTIYHIVQCAMR
jgi:hypothetical protein